MDESIMAAAVSSPKMSPQELKSLLEVTMMLAVS
jgi:hypothetical protein